MKIIFESKNFVVKTLTGINEDRPHVSRNDGGHIIISPKQRLVDRTELAPKIGIELMRLTMVCGEAMTTAMNRQGVNIGRVNYQDNGNWGVFSSKGPHFHIHLYGRAKSAKTQIYGEALRFPKPETGFYKDSEPLTDKDISEIQKEIKTLLNKNKYANDTWGL